MSGNCGWWHWRGLTPRLWRWRATVWVDVSTDVLVGVARWRDEDGDWLCYVGAGPVVVSWRVFRVPTRRQRAAYLAAVVATDGPRLVSEVEDYLRTHPGPEGTGVAP
jgi:hypothetical protein